MTVMIAENGGIGIRKLKKILCSPFSYASHFLSAAGCVYKTTPVRPEYIMKFSVGEHGDMYILDVQHLGGGGCGVITPYQTPKPDPVNGWTIGDTPPYIGGIT